MGDFPEETKKPWEKQLPNLTHFTTPPENSHGKKKIAYLIEVRKIESEPNL